MNQDFDSNKKITYHTLNFKIVFQYQKCDVKNKGLLMQGMNHLLEIKNLLAMSNTVSAASKQQLALGVHFFSFFSIIFYSVSLYCFTPLFCLNRMPFF